MFKIKFSSNPPTYMHGSMLVITKIVQIKHPKIILKRQKKCNIWHYSVHWFRGSLVLFADNDGCHMTTIALMKERCYKNAKGDFFKNIKNMTIHRLCKDQHRLVDMQLMS